MEVAVGTGLAFYEIVKRNPRGRNIGIDISPGMLGKAKRRLKTLSQTNYSLALGDAFDLHEPTESVDVLVNNYMSDLIPYGDMGKILVEFKRVLKKEGRLVLVDMTRGKTAASRVYELIYRVRPAALGGCRGVELSDRLKRLGFAVEARKYHQQMPFPSEVILARKKA
jgi:ubiquinone/menaquinone biosynthesis C-methylase UbiE